MLFGVLFGDCFSASTLAAKTYSARPVLVVLENALPATAAARYLLCCCRFDVNQVLVNDRIKLDGAALTRFVVVFDDCFHFAFVGDARTTRAGGGLVQFVVHMLNSAVPAGAAIITVTASTGLRTAIACCAGGHAGCSHTRERVDVWCWSVNHVSAETNTEISGNDIAQF